MVEIKSPPCEWKNITHFPLDTILDTFEIPNWQRVLSEVHKGTICKAILTNDFYDNAIQVYKIPNGKQKYGVCNGQHRLMALWHLNQEFGVKEYQIVLQIFDSNPARDVFVRFNLGKGMSLGDITKAIDDGTIHFFNHLRDNYNHKATKTGTSFTNLLHAVKFAKDKTPRPLQKSTVRHFIMGISTSDMTYIKKFTRCMNEVSEYVPQSFTYRAPIFRALFRVGYDNEHLTDKKFKEIIKAVIESPKAKQLIKLPNGTEIISFVYQYITNTLCDRIGIPVNKPEVIAYTTRPGDKSG